MRSGLILRRSLGSRGHGGVMGREAAKSRLNRATVSAINDARGAIRWGVPGASFLPPPHSLTVAQGLTKAPLRRGALAMARRLPLC